MLGGCLKSVFPLEADIYTKRRQINMNTGQQKEQWQLWKTVDCSVSPFISTSFKAQGISEHLGEEYEKLGYLKLKTGIDIGRNVQVTNIRNKRSQIVIYKEIELKGAPPTWYNCNGSAPLIDPFGLVMEYDSLIIRAPEQGEKVVIAP